MDDSAATAALFIAIPKGFFPQQDTGLITGISEAAQDAGYPEISRKRRAGKSRLIATERAANRGVRG